MKEKKYLTFANNLKYFMNLNKKTRNDLCQNLNLNYTTVREWCNGTAFPRYLTLEQLANYFKVSVSELIEDPKHSLLDSGSRNTLTLTNSIYELAENDIQRELLLNAIMLNEKYSKIINEQILYYISKQNSDITKE